MPVEFNMCIEFARNGFFQEFDADRDRVQVARSEAGQAVIADRPDQSIRGGGAQVVAFAAPDPAPKPVSRLSSSSGSGG